MAITLETATAASNEANGPASGDTSVSVAITLQNASGNDRCLLIFLAGASGQVGDLTLTSPLFDSVAPTGSKVLNAAGACREVWAVYYWDDAALPASAGSYNFTVTIGNNGSTPSDKEYLIEATGVDQTTPVTFGTTATNFGTTGQTYTPGAGDDILAMLGAIEAAAGAEPTATWSDTQLFEATTDLDLQNGLSVGHSTDGSITGTMDSDETVEGWIPLYLTAAAAGGAVAYPGNMSGGLHVMSGGLH